MLPQRKKIMIGEYRIRTKTNMCILGEPSKKQTLKTYNHTVHPDTTNAEWSSKRGYKQ